jgi:two-component system NtrC family response regulator
MEGASILLVDDNESQRQVIAFWLGEEHYEISAASAVDTALELLSQREFDLVVTDVKMPGASGMELLSWLREHSPSVPVIVMTAYGTVSDAVSAIKLGAFDYLLKPISEDALKVIVRKAIQYGRLVQENRALRAYAERTSQFENIIGHAKKMTELFDLATQVAPRDSTVLLLGESGTGKELLAKAIHLNSARSTGPFVVVNCGAIPETLIESELFGHKKGSFTGAVADRIGKFEAANHGTVFLDEIGELSPALQVRLLRVIQEREIQKIGWTEPLKIDVRVIAATNRNLKTMLEDGSFREDLYYRLSVVTLQIPPLRERREDIALLAEHFVRTFCRRYKLPQRRLSPAAIEVLTQYNWPGNVRELENAIESAIVLSKSEEITPLQFPEHIRQERLRVSQIHLQIPDDGISLEEVERELLCKALEKCGGNQTRAARFLDITRKTLIYRMEKFGLLPVPPSNSLKPTGEDE